MIHVALTAGLRVSELVALRLDDISFQTRYVEPRTTDYKVS
jgi:site-specific recombinase XerD